MGTFPESSRCLDRESYCFVGIYSATLSNALFLREVASTFTGLRSIFELLLELSV